MDDRVITFGCRLNSYESEIIKKILASDDIDKDVVVVHSCAVTNEAERQVKNKIIKLKQQNDNVKIIVVGCAAQLDPLSYATMPGVIKVLGNLDKLKAEHYLDDKKIVVSDINKIDKFLHTPIDDFPDRARAFIEIQNGCNHECTFCAITKARGNNRSLSIENIIEQIHSLLDNGYNEIVFTGVDITDFGADLFGKPSLGIMLRRILKEIPKLKRLRLSSIDVAEISPELFEIMVSEPRMMPHFHLSVQSGNNLILKRMKRRHNREKVIKFCHDIKSTRPEVVFGADIITGFPTEMDFMFQDTVDLIHQADLTYLHVFPYSSKKDTPAAKMPQVELNLRKERARYLREIAEKKIGALQKQMLNTTQSVVIEGGNIGRAENFMPIQLFGEEILNIRSIRTIVINGIDNDTLKGKII